MSHLTNTTHHCKGHITTRSSPFRWLLSSTTCQLYASSAGNNTVFHPRRVRSVMNTISSVLQAGEEQGPKWKEGGGRKG